MVYLMPKKSDTFAYFQEYKALMENQTGKKIKRFRSDNGGEYIGADFKTYLTNAGIYPAEWHHR